MNQTTTANICRFPLLTAFFWKIKKTTKKKNQIQNVIRLEATLLLPRLWNHLPSVASVAGVGQASA